MRQYLFGLCIGFVLIMPSHAHEADSSPDMLIKTLNHCYEDLDKIGPDLAKCVLEKLGNLNNPHGYRALLKDESPSKTIERPVTLMITDKYGDAIVCEGIAKEKIVFKKCINKKIPKDKEFSASPNDL